MTTAETIMIARRRAGLTQLQLGEMAGLSKTSIIRVESGLGVTKVSNIVKLCSALGITHEEYAEAYKEELIAALDKEAAEDRFRKEVEIPRFSDEEYPTNLSFPSHKVELDNEEGED